MDTIWLIVGLLALAVLDTFVAGAGALTLRRGERPARGTFFVLFALVEATPTGYRKKTSAEMLDGSQCGALPALAGGRRSLRDNKNLVCLEMKK